MDSLAWVGWSPEEAPCGVKVTASVWNTSRRSRCDWSMVVFGDRDAGRMSPDSLRKEGRGIGSREMLGSWAFVVLVVMFMFGVLSDSSCVTSLLS